ncbi:MAG: hypothetical protein AB8B68_03970 [Rickettsiaceae bacterium]
MSTSIRLFKRVTSPKSKILFLGYTPEQTTLIDELVKVQCEV